MEDNNEAVDDAQRSSGVLHEAKAMEVENEVDHNNNATKNSDEIAPQDPSILPVAANRAEDVTGETANGGELSHEPAALFSSEVLPENDEKHSKELENGSGEDASKGGEEIGDKVKEVVVVAENRRDEDAEEANGVTLGDTEMQPASEVQREELVDDRTLSRSFLLDASDDIAGEWGTEEEQAAFMRELETFHRERGLDFKPPKFYQEPLNCLKLWRSVIRLGGYEQVTSLKLWRQIGEAFRPPKTCTTVSWTFRGFYEKALLEYEKYKMHRGELPFTDASSSDPPSGSQVDVHAPGPGRARRDAAARAMQGWHSQRLLGNGEVGDPVVKDKNPITTPKREKQLRNIGFLKRKASSPVEHAVKASRVASKPQLEIVVMDVGVPADWVKVNVQRTKDCYEVYALVPGLLREEVRVQSDPAGRLVISGQPEQQDNPWGVTPFKKVVSLPSRIDPHQTSAVVTLHGQLFVRVPFEQPDI